MAGQLTRKKYDACAIDQQTSQFTNQNHMMDLNRYVNCNNQITDPASLVNVESCLRGTDRKASDCSSAQFPNKGSLNCLVDGYTKPIQDRYQPVPISNNGLKQPQGLPCAPLPDYTWPADGKANISSMLQSPPVPNQGVPTYAPQSPVPNQGVPTYAPQPNKQPVPSQGVSTYAPQPAPTYAPQPAPTYAPQPNKQPVPNQGVPQQPAPLGQQIQQVAAPIGQQIQQAAAPLGQQIQQGIQQLFGGNVQGLFSGIFGGVSNGQRLGNSNVHHPDNRRLGNSNVYAPNNSQLGNANVYQPNHTHLGNSNVHKHDNTLFGTANLQPQYSPYNR